MRVKGSRQIKYISDGINLNQLGYFPEFRNKDYYSPKYYFFDFGLVSFPTLGADINGNYWNNFSGNSAIPKIITSKNQPTNIGISLAAGHSFEILGIGGLTNPSGSLLGDFAISSATRDSYFRNAGIPGNPSQPVQDRRLRFDMSGLDTSKTYDFGFFGTRTTATTIRATVYNVSGINIIATGSLITSGPNVGAGGYSGNNNTILNLTGIRPNGNGQIIFYTSSGIDAFQYLNAMKITQR